MVFEKIILLKQNNTFFFLTKGNFTLFINVFTPHLCSFWMIYYIFYIFINKNIFVYRFLYKKQHFM